MELPSSDPPNTAPPDLTGVRAGVDRARLGEPADHWHLHAVCRTLPTDFEPYGFGSATRPTAPAAAAGGCRSPASSPTTGASAPTRSRRGSAC